MAYDNAVVTPESLPAEQQNKIMLPTEKWSDDYALRVVKSDWAYAETYRTNAHDWRYRNADELYLGWSGQRYWDGTRVPRSSLGVPVSFMQIESLLPKTVSPVTNVDGYNFFSETDLGDDEESIVLAWKELITKQLDETHFRAQVSRALKSMKQYGNGVLEVGFEEYEDEYVSFDRKVVPSKFGIIMHPIQGPVPIPTETQEKFSRKISREKKQRPYVRYVSLKDLFVDPNCESPILQDAGYVIKRVYMRAEQIAELRGKPGFNIPSDAELAQLSKAKSTANADVSKLASELYRYNMWNPSQDYTSDPSQKRIPLVEYTRNSRKVWWLQGTEYVIYNQKNRYGEINYYSVPYAEVLDRWHALSVCDVVEGEQRLQQSTVNSRIDELALGIHKPMVKRRGVTIPAYQLKVRPGVVIETENPEGDVKQLEVDNITQQAYSEVQASELRVQKITGLSDLAGQGVPTAGGNSANRTATGVNTQAGATQDRVNYLVETIEDVLIEPVVNAIIRYDRKFLDMNHASNWLKLDSRFAKLDPEKVMNARVSAECRASIKMRARMQFLQVFPQTMQFLLNPELMQLMAQQNQETLNVKEFIHMYMDAMNYSPRNPLIVKLTQQQIQAQQQPPAELMAKLQMQQMQIQSDEGVEQMRLKAKLFDTLIKEIFPHYQGMAELDDKHIQKMAELELGHRQVESQEKTAKLTAAKKKVQ